MSRLDTIIFEEFGRASAEPSRLDSIIADEFSSPAAAVAQSNVPHDLGQDFSPPAQMQPQADFPGFAERWNGREQPPTASSPEEAAGRLQAFVMAQQPTYTPIAGGTGGMLISRGGQTVGYVDAQGQHYDLAQIAAMRAANPPTPPSGPARALPGEFLAAVTRGTRSIASGLDSVARDVLVPIADVATRGLASAGVVTQEEAQQAIDQRRQQGVQDRARWQQAQQTDAPSALGPDAGLATRGVYGVTNLVGEAAPMLTAGAVGGIPALAAAGGAQGYGEARRTISDRLVEKGMTREEADDKARLAAPVVGAIEGALNAVQFHRLFGRLADEGGGLTGIIRRRAVDAVIGTGFGVASDTAQQGAERATGASDQWDWNRVAQAAKSGALTQTVLGGVIEAAGHAARAVGKPGETTIPTPESQAPSSPVSTDSSGTPDLPRLDGTNTPEPAPRESRSPGSELVQNQDADSSPQPLTQPVSDAYNLPAAPDQPSAEVAQQGQDQTPVAPGPQETPPADKPTTDYASMTSSQVRREAKARGLDRTGPKPDVINRLIQDDAVRAAEPKPPGEEAATSLQETSNGQQEGNQEGRTQGLLNAESTPSAGSPPAGGDARPRSLASTRVELSLRGLPSKGPVEALNRRLAEATDARRVEANEALGTLYDSAKAGATQPYRLLDYLEVDPKTVQRVKDAGGPDITGYSRSAGVDALVKVIRDHGDPATEASRGNLPVTREDIARLPEIVSAPDTVRMGDTSAQELQTVVSEKRVNGHVVVVEEVRHGKDRLALKTMYKRKAGPGRADALPEGSPPLIRPERSQATGNQTSIAQSPPGVKGGSKTENRDATLKGADGAPKSDSATPDVASRPERLPEGKNLEERLLAFADAEKKARQQSQIPRGRTTGAAVLFHDLTSIGLEVAARAAAKGVKAGKAVAQVVREVLGQDAKDADVRRVHGIANGVMRDVYDGDTLNPERFDAVVRAVRDVTDRTRPSSLREPAERTPTTKETIRANTGQTKTPEEKSQARALRRQLKAEERAAGRGFKAAAKDAPKAVRAVQKAYKAGKADAYREAQPIIDRLVQTVKEGPKRTQAAMDLARRGGQDEAKARQDVRDAIRQQVLNIAKDAPRQVRGDLYRSLAKAETPRQYLAALRKLQRRTDQYLGRQDAGLVYKFTKGKVLKKTAGMTDAARQQLTQIRVESVGLRNILNDPQADLTDVHAAAGRLADLAQQAGTIIQTNRAKFKEIRGTRGLNAMQIAGRATKVVTERKAAIDTKGLAVDPEAGLVTRINRKFRDLRTELASVAGVNDANLKPVIYDNLRKAENERANIERNATKQANDKARAAGFEGLDGAVNQLSAFAGKGATRRIKVRLGTGEEGAENGTEVNLALGEALSLYGHFTDPDTAALIARGQKFKPESGRKTHVLEPVPADLPGLKASLEKAQPGITKFIDGMKAVNHTLWPREQETVYRLTGVEPPTPTDRYPRHRAIEHTPADKAAKEKLPMAQQASMQGFLETNGAYTARKETSGIPLLLTNPAQVLREEIRRSATMIAMGEPVRDAFNVLENPELAKVLDARHPGALDAIRNQIVATYAKPPQQTGIGKLVSGLNGTLAVSYLAANPSTMLVNQVGITRMLSDVPAVHVAAGVKDASLNTPSLLRDLQDRRGFFYERYDKSAADRLSGNATEGGQNVTGGFARAMKRAARNVASLDFKAAFKDTRTAMRTTLELYNLADAPIAVTAYAAKMHQARHEHPDWSDTQVRDWAADQAEQLVRDTQPVHSALDSSFGPTASKGSAGSALYLFSGDTLRVRNRIVRAFAESNKRGIKVLASEVANLALSLGVKAAVPATLAYLAAKAFNLSDDDRKRLVGRYTDPAQIALNAGQEVLSTLVPGPFSKYMQGMVTQMVTGRDADRTGVPAFDATAEMGKALADTAHNVYSMVHDAVEGDPVKMRDALNLARNANTLASATVGNPAYPWLTKILSAAQAKVRGDEKAIPDAVKAYRESRGAPTNEQSKERQDGTERLIRALRAGDQAGFTKAAQQMRDAGVKLTPAKLDEIIKAHHPLSDLPMVQRRAFLRKQPDEMRARIEGEVDRYEEETRISARRKMLAASR